MTFPGEDGSAVFPFLLRRDWLRRMSRPEGGLAGVREAVVVAREMLYAREAAKKA